MSNQEYIVLEKSNGNWVVRFTLATPDLALAASTYIRNQGGYAWAVAVNDLVRHLGGPDDLAAAERRISMVHSGLNGLTPTNE